MRTIRLLLFPILFAVLTAVTAGATITFEVGNYKYRAEDDAYRCTVTGLSTAGAAANLTTISIPSTVTYNGRLYRVATIGSMAFKGNTTVTMVRLNWGMSTVNMEAFAGCTYLNTVYLPSSIETLMSNVFDGCIRLRHVYYAGLEPCSAAASAFPANSDIYLYLPPIVANKADIFTSAGAPWTRFTTISGDIDANDFQVGAATGGDGAYALIIPKQDNIDGDKWTTTYREASIIGVAGTCTTFKPKSTYVLASNQIRLKIIKIEGEACQGTTSITTVDLSGNSDLKSVNSYAFNGCTSLTTATVRAEHVGDYAFAGCTSLTSFTLSEGVQSLGAGIISGTSVTTLQLPASLTEFIYSAHGASKLTSIIPHANNQYFSGYNGTLYSKDYSVLVCHPNGANLDKIHANCQAIDDRAFQNCSQLTNVALPYGVKSIGNYAFYNCTGLKELIVPGSVTKLGQYFADKTALSTLSINCKYSAVTDDAIFDDWKWADGTVLRVPVGAVEQWSIISNSGNNIKVEAGAYDFALNGNDNSFYHMSVLYSISGSFHDETGEVLD